MEEILKIALNGLAQGKTSLEWSLGTEFFGAFDNQDILDAAIRVEAEVEKSGRYVGVVCNMTGSVTVPCDRCLDPLVIDIDEQALLSVKFGEAGSESAEVKGDGREIIVLQDDDTELDLSQVVYDYVCLAMPMVRVHQEGECNPEAMRYLGSDADRTEDEVPKDSPFAALKTLLND